MSCENHVNSFSLFVISVTCSLCRVMATDTLTSRQQQILQKYDGAYSAEHRMVGGPFNSPGYHSTVPQGTWVHPTRQSLEYAASLLARSAPGDVDRAVQIIPKVLSLQDTNPKHRTYGIWPWLLEEPLEKMSPPDWNWADFCGAQLAEMLILRAELLPADLKQDMRVSLGHAARAIRQRNVQPSYTNIAIMGAVVCAAAGEILEDGSILDYGRDRLERVVKHAEYHGGFNEYNSPTYTLVALRECDRALQLVHDERTRAAAATLRHIAWKTIADSFHPGTQQWAGPHSRAYSDTISPELASELRSQCPVEFAARFRELPEDPWQLRRTFIRRDPSELSTIGTTWHSADACLGSVNRSMLWTQRRTLIAYWKADTDSASVVVFRQRFLRDGRDFCSIAVANAQEGPRVLSVFYPLRNRGSWHPTLDRPKDGRFTTSDLRVRYELRGAGVHEEWLDQNRFVLVAGTRQAVIHTSPSQFDGRKVVWESSWTGNTITVDGICYHGAPKVFDFTNPPRVSFATGIELLDTDDPISPNAPELSQKDGQVTEASWDVADNTLTIRSAASGT